MFLDWSQGEYANRQWDKFLFCFIPLMRSDIYYGHLVKF